MKINYRKWTKVILFIVEVASNSLAIFFAISGKMASAACFIGAAIYTKLLQRM